MSDNQELTVKQENQLTAESMTAISTAVQEIMRPIMATLAEIMGKNTEAVQYLAAQQKIQSDHMAALEKQIRLNTLVTQVQTRHINNAIKDRSRGLLEKFGLADDGKCIKTLSGHIRKAVLSRYGVSSLHDVPQCEYSVVMQQIGSWNDMLVLRDVKKQAAGRKAENPFVPMYDEKTESGLLEE